MTSIHITQGNWNELKGKIKARWAKFTDDDVETVKGNLQQLAGKIEKAYGYGKEQAEREFQEFKKTLDTKVEAVTNTVMEKKEPTVAAAATTVAPASAAAPAAVIPEAKVKIVQ